MKKLLMASLLCLSSFNLSAAQEIELKGISPEDDSECYFRFTLENDKITSFEGLGLGEEKTFNILAKCDGLYCLQKELMEARSISGYDFSNPETLKTFEMKQKGSLSNYSLTLKGKYDLGDSVSYVKLTKRGDTITFLEKVKTFGIVTMSKKKISCKVN